MLQAGRVGREVAGDVTYLLRLVLKVTLWLGRNFHLRVAELVPISSRAKSNNFVDWNKLNSNY